MYHQFFNKKKNNSENITLFFRTKIFLTIFFSIRYYFHSKLFSILYYLRYLKIKSWLSVI